MFKQTDLLLQNEHLNKLLLEVLIYRICSKILLLFLEDYFTFRPEMHLHLEVKSNKNV